MAREAVAEDIGRGDITTTAIVPAEARARAAIVAKQAGILAGMPLIREVKRVLDRRMRITPLAREGSAVRPGQRIAVMSGSLRAILTGERVTLNFLSRLSGIATLTRAFVREAGKHGVAILDTRKTTPLLRMLEKYAVRVGGGRNHRLDLSSAVLIKDNHIEAAGSLPRAVRLVRARLGKGVRIQVEAQSLKQVREALAARVEFIMLDNLPHGALRLALRMMRGRAKSEVSGGVTLKTVLRLARLKPDYISVGALTHSAPALDFSLEILKS
jgi:nicotinate-nucleotide pyrophosphorylase (carboxylating)